MAANWLTKLKELLPVGKSTPAPPTEPSLPGRLPDPSAKKVEPAKPAAPPPTASNALTWTETFLRSMPIALLAVGGLISLTTELIGLWAIFGYLLVAAAPICYWLIRIDAKMGIIIDHQRRGR